ncbi:hypothetical protein QE250_09850, partial [Chromatiaceae bacterium AAb-1]|nr:hypothetical protein [Chromatiaceae bacterium AAb-1]
VSLKWKRSILMYGNMMCFYWLLLNPQIFSNKLFLPKNFANVSSFGVIPAVLTIWPEKAYVTKG